MTASTSLMLEHKSVIKGAVSESLAAEAHSMVNAQKP